VFLLRFGLHGEELGEGEAKASEKADVKKSTAGEVIGKGITGAAIFHSLMVRLLFYGTFYLF
jgi:hypothetical protein